MLHFQHFKKDISGIQIPDKFTFPFYYEPNLLAKIAAKELQEYLEKQTEFKHEFGIKNSTAKGFLYGSIYVSLPSFNGKVPLFILFRAFGIESDKEIYYTIFGNKLDENEKNYFNDFIRPKIV